MCPIVPDPRGRSENSCSRAKYLFQLERCRDLELIVSAVRGLLIGTPAQEDGCVPEASSLHVVVLDLAHALDAQRLPREILPRTPPALCSGQARRSVSHGVGPFTPGVPIECALAQWFELAN